jgi:hypothetical protein
MMTHSQYVSGRRRMKCVTARAWRIRPHGKRNEKNPKSRSIGEDAGSLFTVFVK